MKEVGVYRVSGLSSDVQRLKKAFETSSKLLIPLYFKFYFQLILSNSINFYWITDTYEADLLMKEIDIHAVTGLLKLYLRELPESLFTNAMYKKYFDAFSQ